MISAAQLDEFRARFRALLDACPPWSDEQREQAGQLAASVRMRQARDAARANAGAIARAAETAGEAGSS
jgi:hypothetical protein